MSWSWLLGALNICLYRFSCANNFYSPLIQSNHEGDWFSEEHITGVSSSGTPNTNDSNIEIALNVNGRNVCKCYDQMRCSLTGFRDWAPLPCFGMVTTLWTRSSPTEASILAKQTCKLGDDRTTSFWAKCYRQYLNLANSTSVLWLLSPSILWFSPWPLVFLEGGFSRGRPCIPMGIMETRTGKWSFRTT